MKFYSVLKIVNEIYPLLKMLYIAAADLNLLCLLSFYRCLKLNEK
jgi:hypothetical protein